MDEDVTDLIIRDLHEPTSRSWCLFAFRKALGMPIDKNWQNQLLGQNLSSELLSQYFSEQMQIFMQNEHMKETVWNRPQRIKNQQVHITELIESMSLAE